MTPGADVDLVSGAAELARKVHEGGLRKGTDISYFDGHLAPVAKLVEESGGTEVQVAAACGTEPRQLMLIQSTGVQNRGPMCGTPSGRWEDGSMLDMTSDATPLAIDRAERDRQAVELRAVGASYQQIADMGDYNSKQAAHAAVKRVRSNMVSDTVRDLRRLQIERLLDLLASVSSNAIDPEAERPDRPGETQTAFQHLAYVNQAQALIKDIRKLHCLDQEIPAQELLAEGSVFIDDDTMEFVELIRAAGLTGDDIETWLRGRDG